MLQKLPYVSRTRVFNTPSHTLCLEVDCEESHTCKGVGSTLMAEILRLMYWLAPPCCVQALSFRLSLSDAVVELKHFLIWDCKQSSRACFCSSFLKQYLLLDAGARLATAVGALQWFPSLMKDYKHPTPPPRRSKLHKICGGGGEMRGYFRRCGKAARVRFPITGPLPGGWPRSRVQCVFSLPSSAAADICPSPL